MKTSQNDTRTRNPRVCRCQEILVAKSCPADKGLKRKLFQSDCSAEGGRAAPLPKELSTKCSLLIPFEKGRESMGREGRGLSGACPVKGVQRWKANPLARSIFTGPAC